MSKQKHIVLLGGGVGTSNLLKGLKKYDLRFTVITSMADDGGSSGKLRKAYDIMPPGDIVNCIAALIPDDQQELASLLLYRFPGENKANTAIDKHKLGNLIMLAEIQRTGDFYKAIDVTKKIFGVTADLLPATDQHVQLSGVTKDDRRIDSETTLDLALYSQPHGLKKVYITPSNPQVNKKVIESLLAADVIISGPGDLYTNQLPVLIVPEIKDALLKSKAEKIFVLNVANKPVETKDFSLQTFIQAIKDHIGEFPFTTIIANNNFTTRIPKQYDYDYITIDSELREDNSLSIIEADLVDTTFPLYHDSTKLARVIANEL